jgi:hypothetical protein
MDFTRIKERRGHRDCVVRDMKFKSTRARRKILETSRKKKGFHISYNKQNYSMVVNKP